VYEIHPKPDQIVDFRFLSVAHSSSCIRLPQKFETAGCLKNKHQAVSQRARRFGKRRPPAADEHLQKPHNAGSRPQARFFNTLIEHNRR
jgi:hypothetical protein